MGAYYRARVYSVKIPGSLSNLCCPRAPVLEAAYALGYLRSSICLSVSSWLLAALKACGESAQVAALALLQRSLLGARGPTHW
jgi:hypothetical protein